MVETMEPLPQPRSRIAGAAGKPRGNVPEQGSEQMPTGPVPEVVLFYGVEEGDVVFAVICSGMGTLFQAQAGPKKNLIPKRPD
jgi:hypothetical protein